MTDGRRPLAPHPAVLAVGAAAGLLAALAAAAAGPPGGPARPLVAGATVSVELAGGETASFALDLDAGGGWRIAVEQLGVDVAIEVADELGQEILVGDRPLDRDGTEYALLTTETAGGYRLSVRSRVASAPGGRVRVTVEPFERSATAVNDRWLAEAAETEAAAAYARGGAEGRRQALAAYLRALPHWRASGEEQREALAGYSVGVLHRLLGEPREALEMVEQAEARFAALAEPRWRASALNEIGLARVSLGELPAARAAFERSEELLAGAPDPFRRAVARSNVCLTDLHLGALREGIDCYRDAGPLYEAAGDPQSEAMALTNSGRAYDILGEPDRALASYERALAIQRASGDASGEALTLNNLAILHTAQGDLSRALELYGRAADIYRSLADKERLALAVSNAGSTYWSLGEPSRARAFFEQALALQREAGNLRGEALSLTNLARIHEREGEPDLAGELFGQALELRRRIGHRSGEGRSHRDLGLHLLAAGDPAGALDHLDRALTISREVEDREGEARALEGIGEARAEAGDLEAAAEALADALGRYRAIGGVAGEARALTVLARLDRRHGRLEEARDRVAAALERVESQRARIVSPDLRATFLAGRREAYELEIALLMDLHRAAPERGYDARALASSERARARSLLELLGESGADLRHGVDPDLRRERQRLLHRLDAAERARRSLVAGPHRPDEVAAKERTLETILADLDRVEAELRDANPAFSSLIRPPVLGAPEIQRLLETPGGAGTGIETVLLIYSLGAERSFVWWVETDSVTAYELPPREAIESVARRLHAQLSTLDPTAAGAGAEDAAALARMILGPVAGRLDGQRLAVVADGALHHVPFAALPDPTTSGERTELLLRRHPIVHLPSASALAEQRRLLAGRAPAPRRALVIADPVFSRTDVRAPRDGGVDAGAADEVAAVPFVRLAGSRREARAIAALAAAGEVTVATGLEASREAVAEDALAPYRVVHFATHGVIDDRTPRLSGLVLSQFDRQGRAVDGFFRLHDVYALSLNADLVVLSGCRTGSGREVEGEGLVGLTRAFMYAGARRVMASLWPVQDRATAELMERFYRALWIDGLEPAAALRAAQLSMAGDPRWSDPYYWAGFSLQGEWRPVEMAGADRPERPAEGAR